MENLRSILANNLKENRKRCGFSQSMLAEKANITTQYVAMIEISRKFPTPEMLERLAEALGMEAYALFMVKPSPKDAMERLHDTLVCNIERVVSEAVERSVAPYMKR
ncbi:MAG: helix-turn-helix transcriptional regulator [Spirochaetota bacterium]|jgi:transcriptional regulator with XRE-family HTH domain|nr:helix-turn-helix transcriptional regulator [Spirochaetota bacterium]